MSDEAKPVAWAVIGDDYEYATLLAEHAGAVADEEGGTVIPLYRSPALTDAEREAVNSAASDAEQACCGEPEKWLMEIWRKRAATLRGLLERLG